MRRLLVVTYYFPPSGGAGVQRVLKWVKYLRSFDVEPTVLTVKAGAYPGHDASLHDDIPPETDVHRTHALDPFGIYAWLRRSSRQAAVTEVTGRITEEDTWGARVVRWVRANLFVPDARVGWVPFAVLKGRQLLRSRRFDAVLTSGPPHSTHLIGLALHRYAGVPWIADFRDPWTDIHYNHSLPRSQFVQALDAALERAVLRNASALITASPSMRLLLTRKNEKIDTPAEVIYNGFDADDFREVIERRTDAFVVSYVGTLYGQPHALWNALVLLRAQHEAEGLRVRIVGSVPPGTETVLGTLGIEEAVDLIPYCPHDKAVQEMQRASVLLLTLEPWAQAEAIVPGKVFEYMASERPILGIGPLESDVARLIEAAGAGRMFGSKDSEGVASFLSEAYEAWAQGNPLRGAPQAHVARFKRQEQTGQLAALVERLRP